MDYSITDYYSLTLAINWNLDSDQGDLMPDELPPNTVDLDYYELDQIVKYASDDTGNIDTYLVDEAIMTHLSDTYGFYVNEFDIQDYTLKSSLED